MSKYNVVDLFAGAGGLSLGFDMEGSYKIVASVENNIHAKKTYQINNPGVKMYDDVTKMDYQQILSEFKEIDVVIGGPPCQGFSNANRKRNSLVNENNQLVKEYVRAVQELRPRVFVMENVKMLKSDTHRFYYTRHDKEQNLLEKYNIPSAERRIDLLSEKFSSDSLFNLCKDINKINCYIWSAPTYQMLNILRRYVKNPRKFSKTYSKNLSRILSACRELGSLNYEDTPKILRDDSIHLIDELGEYSHSGSDDYVPEKLSSLLNSVVSIQQAFLHIRELYDKSVYYEVIRDNGIKITVKSYSVCDYIKGVLGSGNNQYKMVSGIMNAAEFGVPQKRQRFILIGMHCDDDTDLSLPKGTLTSDKFRTVRDAIENLENVRVHYEITDGPEHLVVTNKSGPLTKELCDNPEIYNHVVTKTRDTALSRFAALKEGQNFHDLADDMKDTYTDVSKTQKTIYQRLKYDEPSGTVLNVRKSMWIHPVLNRAVSIREAARLQTFPDRYVFYGTKDAQYQQIGNAVPPLMGKAIAEKISSLLDKQKERRL